MDVGTKAVLMRFESLKKSIDGKSLFAWRCISFQNDLLSPVFEGFLAKGLPSILDRTGRRSVLMEAGSDG